MRRRQVQGAEGVKVNQLKNVGSNICSNQQFTRGEEGSASRVELVETSVGVVCDRRSTARREPAVTKVNFPVFHQIKTY